MIIIKEINKELTVLRRSVILTGFMDPDFSLNDHGLQKLKRNHQSTNFFGRVKNVLKATR